jgi:hypothetical protein
MDEAQQVAKERAVRDLAHIKTLQNSEAFQEYYQRRIVQKRTEAEKDLKYKPIGFEERELRRQAFLIYEELERMLATDETNIQAFLSRQN